MMKINMIIERSLSRDIIYHIQNLEITNSDISPHFSQCSCFNVSNKMYTFLCTNTIHTLSVWYGLWPNKNLLLMVIKVNSIRIFEVWCGFWLNVKLLIAIMSNNVPTCDALFIFWLNNRYLPIAIKSNNIYTFPSPVVVVSVRRDGLAPCSSPVAARIHMIILTLTQRNSSG